MNHQKQPDAPECASLFVQTHRCGSWWCNHCARRKAAILRHAMLTSIERWARPVLVTLTVDRAAWPDGPESVHAAVSDQSLVARLMKRMGVTRWVWVLEFQKKTGEGWPHWHVLIDCPNGFISFDELRRLWWGKWGVGNIDVRMNISARSAVWYLSAYLNKVVDAVPQWLLERSKSVRRVGSSKEVGSLVRHQADRDGSPEVTAPDDDGRPAPPGLERDKKLPVPLLWRVAECGQISRITRNTGGLPHQWPLLGWVNRSADELFPLITPGPDVRVDLAGRSVLTIELPLSHQQDAVKAIIAAGDERPVWQKSVERAWTIWHQAIGHDELDSRPIPRPPYLGRAFDEIERRVNPPAPLNVSKPAPAARLFDGLGRANALPHEVNA